MTISKPIENWNEAVNRLYNESDEAKRMEDAKRRALGAAIDRALGEKRRRQSGIDDRAREEGEAQ